MFERFISEGMISVTPLSRELSLIGLVYMYMYECLIVPLPHVLQIMHLFLNLSLLTFAAFTLPYTQWK